MPARKLRQTGYALIAIGVLTIVAAVVWVLEVANGPGTGPKSFAARRGYDQVKESVHETFPYAFAVGLAGLALALFGGRLAQRSDERAP